MNLRSGNGSGGKCDGFTSQLEINLLTVERIQSAYQKARRTEGFFGKLREMRMNCNQNRSKSRLVWSECKRGKMRGRLDRNEAILTAE